ncbi:MAG: hypothetical protein P8X73_18565 [Ignavibacteriaceae bacterium]
MDQHKVIFSKLDWENPQSDVRYRKYRSGGKRLRLVVFDKSFEEQYWCLTGHIGLVIKGEIEIDFNGNVVHYEAGNAIFILPGEAHKHKVKAVSDQAIIFLVEDVNDES